MRGEGESRVRREQLHHLALVEDVAAEEHPLAAHLARRVRDHLIEEEEQLLEARRAHLHTDMGGWGVSKGLS